VFLGNIDGQVEIWDMHDQVNKYSFKTSLCDNAVVKLSISDGSIIRYLAVGDEKGFTRRVKLPNFLSQANLETEKKWLQEFIDTQVHKIEDFSTSKAANKQKAKKINENDEAKRGESDETELWAEWAKTVKEIKAEFNYVLDDFEKEIVK